MQKQEEKILLILSEADGQSSTRTLTVGDYITPTDTEKEIAHLDVFIFGPDGSNAHYERIASSGSSQEVPLSKPRSMFVEGEAYEVYAIANYTGSNESFATLTKNGLQNLTLVSPNVHVTGMDPGAGDVPSLFLMTGLASGVILNEGSTLENKEVEIELKRAVAKITVVLGTKTTDEARVQILSVADGDYYVNRKVANFVNKTFVLPPENEEASDPGADKFYSNASPSTVGVEYRMEPTPLSVIVTAYSYANYWEGKPAMENESYLVLKVPIKFREESSQPFGEEVIENNWYKIPLNVNGNHSLRRNHSYFIAVTIDGKGASQEETPVELAPVYFKVQEYIEHIIDAGGETENVRYLSLGKEKVVVKNAPSGTLSFASSSPIQSIKVDRVYFIDKFGREQNINRPRVTANYDADVLNGNITVNSTLAANSLLIRYINLTVTNDQGLQKTFVIEQYPLEYVTNTQGWYSYRDDFDNGSGNPTTYVNRGTSPYYIGASWSDGKWSYKEKGEGYFFTSKVVTGYDSSDGASTIKYYSWYSNSGGIRNQVRNGSTVSNLNNARMYHVEITSTPEGTDYVLGLPRITDGITDGRADNAKVVSPSFMIASQLGAVLAAGNVTQAARHCEQYVEVTNRGNRTDNRDVVAYHDWRLPTEAEINIIYKYQHGSDAIDEVLTGRSYWSASGPVTNPNPSITDGGAIRCIRDAYKDGESK